MKSASNLKHRATGTAKASPTTVNGHSKPQDTDFTANYKMGKKNFAKFDVFIFKWRIQDILCVWKRHPIPFVFGSLLLFFMGVEYTLRMIPASAPPFDIGFIATKWLHSILASSPALNSTLAGLNTVFVFMQTAYILWTWLVEGRIRPTVSTLFMFTCRGVLGYATQLPLPEDFLGSGVDFPVGNVSFFLFYSGHVAGSVIASLDMRRMERWELARLFDVFNVLQVVRLLGTRGHYTIDLAVGVGAGMLFDSLGEKYVESRKKYQVIEANSVDGLVN